MWNQECPQDGDSVCCCYNYHVDVRLQNCVVRWVLRLIGCMVSIACYVEREYPQDGSQWRNRRGAGGQSAPRDFWPGNFCWRIGKKEARKKGKRGENWEEKVENWKWKQENVRKRGEDLFFFLLFTFENDENLFWSTKMGFFLPGKSISRREKNQEKWLCPLRKICLLRPWW